jgi:hypothetical protein
VELMIHHRTSSKLLASKGPMIFGVLSGPGSSALELAVEVIDAQLERYPAVSFLLVVEHGSPTPTPEERRRMQASLATYGDRLVVGYALCGLGFWANAVRSIMVAVSRLAGTEIIAYGSVEATAKHIARELVGVDADEMTATCEQLRAQLREEASSAAAM